jgi:MFS family permease
MLQSGVTEPSAYPTQWRAWPVVIVIFIASIISAIDRGIFSLVIDPIRHDLHITDVQISLLQGLSFGILYATAGVALGLTADRYSRRNLLALGVLIWSIATVMGGFAQNFGELFATRVVVGLGEATLGPCTISIVADLFPPHRRGRPVSFCLLGQALGVGLSVLLVGLILSTLPGGFAIPALSIGTLAPWRIAFILFGLTGLVVVGLILTIGEPRRQGVALKAVDGSRLRAAARHFRRGLRMFAPLYFSFAVVSAGFYGTSAWGAVFVMRKFGLSAPQTGHYLGTATLISAVIGSLIAGNLVDILGRAGTGSKFRLLTWVPIFALPGACAVFAPNPIVAIVLLSTNLSSFTIFSTTFLTTMQDITPNDMRGVGISISGLMNIIVGATCGPLLIALATEYLYRDPTLVGWSILTVILPVILLGAGLASLALRGFRTVASREGGVLELAVPPVGAAVLAHGGGYPRQA